MERSKLKLAVIFLLAALDLCLLGIVVWQNHSARSYETAAMEQAMLYLENHGIRARRETIPWETSLDVPVKRLPEHILPETPLPENGLGESFEVLAMRRPETLLADFVREADRLGARCSELQSITEGYACTAQSGRVILTPMWVVDTDAGSFYLDCAEGSLSRTL